MLEVVGVQAACALLVQHLGLELLSRSRLLCAQPPSSGESSDAQRDEAAAHAHHRHGDCLTGPCHRQCDAKRASIANAPSAASDRAMPTGVPRLTARAAAPEPAGRRLDQALAARCRSIRAPGCSLDRQARCCSRRRRGAARASACAAASACSVAAAARGRDGVEPEALPLDIVLRGRRADRRQQAGRAWSCTPAPAIARGHAAERAAAPRSGARRHAARRHRASARQGHRGLMVVARTLRRAHRAGRAADRARRAPRSISRSSTARMVARRHASTRRSAAIRTIALKQAVREDGREAVTHYRVRERFRAHDADRVPARNRPHAPDPRAHGALGDPLVGDAQYGGRRRSCRRARAASSTRRCGLSGARRCTPSGSSSRIRRPASTIAFEAPSCRRTWPRCSQALRAQDARCATDTRAVRSAAPASRGRLRAIAARLRAR